MTESVEVKIARLEERLAAVDKKVEANNDIAVASAAETKQQLAALMEQLKTLLSISSEWRGVRKALTALGAILLPVAGVAGATLSYLLRR